MIRVIIVDAVKRSNMLFNFFIGKAPLFFLKTRSLTMAIETKSNEKPSCKQRIQRESLLSALIVGMLAVIVGGLAVIARVLAAIARTG
jgi:hypothetical protein